MKHNHVISGLLTALLLGALFSCLLPTAARAEGQWNVYLGQLHSHSGSSDKIGPVGEVYDAAKEANMDFFAVTDYSHSFENAENGAIAADGTALSPTWKAGKEGTSAASGQDFVSIYGYEMAWQRDLRLGHIVTFATPGWQCRGQSGFQTLASYYDALTKVDTAIGMFTHPGEFYGDFQGFSGHRWDYDDHMALVEVSGENGSTYFESYQAALDIGWHVAPAANGASHTGDWGASPVRTGILANTLSESSLYDAIRARRVYATLDSSLKLQYFLDDHIMGSRVTGLDRYTATFQLSSTEGTIEMVSQNGKVVASCPAAQTSLTLPSGYPYYYLRLVRDGKTVAVTAPVWVETPKDFGISQLSSSVTVPVQQEETVLSFTLYNHEQAALTLTSIQLTADGKPIWQGSDDLPGGTEREFTVPYSHDGVGITKFKLSVSGVMAGTPVSFEKELTLSYRPAVLNAQIWVDGRHSNASYDELKSLTALAEKADMDVGIFHGSLPEEGRVLIIPCPSKEFSEEYPQAVAEFVEKGGQLILCGHSGNNDNMNYLLRYLGSTMSLNQDTARDPVHNGGDPASLYPDSFNPSQWDTLTGSEFYSQQQGCTLNPGKGTWLVRGKETMEGSSRVLLAKEPIGKGTLYLAGSFFLDDTHMPLPKNQWDSPTGNQLLIEAILDIQRSRLDISKIKDVRQGKAGDVFRVQGYVNAGTSREHNRFPETIYLQDSSGGIEITHFEIPDIQISFRLDITGQLYQNGENPALKLVSCEVMKDDLYRFDPDRLFHAASMNYTRHGGELMKVEGTVTKIELTSDGLGIRRFILKDPLGVPAEVLVEPYIRSGTYGVNDLAQEVVLGENVRALGLLHLEEGSNPVIRVRNCDEVMQVPPIPEFTRDKKDKDREKEKDSNPKTGDTFFTFEYFWSTIAKKEGF